MTAAGITPALLRVALDAIRTGSDAQDVDDRASYYAGGIDALMAILPDTEGPAAPLEDPVTTVARALPQGAAANACPWTLPDSIVACATLDDLLPDAVPATPYRVVDLVLAQERWAALVLIADENGDPEDQEWRIFADEASARAYCDLFIEPSADTPAEPDEDDDGGELE